MNVIHDEAREKELQNICFQVQHARLDVYYNPNGADSSTCPFCRESVGWADADLTDINHAHDCAYLIAKDLSTNHH
jgi:hypothetical protein